VVREILFAAGRDGDGLSSTERRALLEELERIRESDQLPTFLAEQTFALVREQGRWRIFENWGAAVRVHFSGEVKDELPWEFTPVQAVVLAKPGETLQTVYRVKNLSDQPVTAKARHIDEPEEYVDYLDTIQCFCFIQQTLAPGEEMELPLRFRVAWDVPLEVKEFYVHYEFYPIESFPGE
jgi:cytochrome c oxidase assembly protein Cox11